MFSTFPDGWPGVGLLLLRVAAGGVLIARCLLYLGKWSDIGLIAILVCLLTFASAVLLAVGYLTRSAAVVASLATIIPVFNWFLHHAFLESKLAGALLSIITAALICLGPGAFSLDSRLFGRREIIIPKIRAEN